MTGKEKINILNTIIKNAIGKESEGKVTGLLNLSARATIYLRNTDAEKFEGIEDEINDAINTYGKYQTGFKLTGKKSIY